MDRIPQGYTISLHLVDQTPRQRAWACSYVCKVKGTSPSVPGSKPDSAFLVVFCTSAYGRPLTSLSFVCLRARDHQCDEPLF